MKIKIIKLCTYILLCFSMNAGAQIKKRPCTAYPTSTVLYQLLATKPVFLDSRNFRLRCNVTDSIKQRLLYLLIPNWTKTETDNYLKRDLIQHKKVYAIEEKSILIAKGNDSLYKVVFDSISNAFKKVELDYIKTSRLTQVDGSIYKTVANLNMKEAVPIIKKYFASYNKDLAELCLARLGDKPLQKKIIKTCITIPGLQGEDWLSDFENKQEKLAFINTQESVYELHNWLDSTRMIPVSSKGAEGWGAYRVIGHLQYLIENEDLQALVKNVDNRGACPCSGELIMKVKQWMIKNKGNYKLNPEYSAF